MGQENVFRGVRNRMGNRLALHPDVLLGLAIWINVENQSKEF